MHSRAWQFCTHLSLQFHNTGIESIFMPERSTIEPAVVLVKHISVDRSWVTKVVSKFVNLGSHNLPNTVIGQECYVITCRRWTLGANKLIRLTLDGSLQKGFICEHPIARRNEL